MEKLIENPLVILAITLWTLPWKGYALWLSARKDKKWWFIALLVINTIGILEILYIFVFSKKGKKSGTKEPGEEK